MSTEIHVIIPPGVPPPSKNEWETAIASLQLALVFDKNFSPDQARGFCPMSIAGKKGVCEVDLNLETVESLRKSNSNLSSFSEAANVFSFRFGGNFREAACAYAAAAGLIGRYGAVLYDTTEGTLSRDADLVAVTSRQMLGIANLKTE